MPNAGDSGVSSSAAPRDPDWLPPELNTGVAHTARVYNYWLGGRENFAADRALGDAMIAAMPSTRFAARANRAFLGRAVRFLAAEAGIGAARRAAVRQLPHDLAPHRGLPRPGAGGGRPGRGTAERRHVRAARPGRGGRVLRRPRPR